MRRAILVIVAVSVLAPVAALAAPGDPQKKPTKADTAGARAISIFASDLGSGWKAVKSSSGDKPGPRCSTYHPDQSDLVETGRYESPDFTRADGSFVSSSTGVFRTARMARSGYSQVAAPGLSGCFGELFTKEITKPNSAKIVSAGPLGFPRLGDRSNAYRVVVSIKSPSGTGAVTIDMVLFNRGRIDVGMIFFSIGKPFPASFERALAARLASRAQ